jgi:hypothetical protein
MPPVKSNRFDQGQISTGDLALSRACWNSKRKKKEVCEDIRDHTGENASAGRDASGPFS